MEALSRNVYTGRANEYSVEFDNYDEDLSEIIEYPSDNPTDSDDDTL